jgi:hypothetical protein
VLIGIDLGEPDIRAALDACLLTDAEFREGPHGWRAHLDPFPVWSRR